MYVTKPVSVGNVNYPNLQRRRHCLRNGLVPNGDIEFSSDLDEKIKESERSLI